MTHAMTSAVAVGITVVLRCARLVSFTMSQFVRTRAKLPWPCAVLCVCVCVCVRSLYCRKAPIGVGHALFVLSDDQLTRIFHSAVLSDDQLTRIFHSANNALC